MQNVNTVKKQISPCSQVSPSVHPIWNPQNPMLRIELLLISTTALALLLIGTI